MIIRCYTFIHWAQGKSSDNRIRKMMFKKVWV